MTSFSSSFNTHGTDKQKHHGYAPMYERLFPAEMRDKVTAVLEIGVDRGASLKAWRDVFPKAMVVGIEKYPVQLTLPDRIVIIQKDVILPDTPALAEQYGLYDMIVDDGSHLIGEQLSAMASLWRLLKPGGVYVIEEFAWYSYGTPGNDRNAQAAVRVKPEE